MAKIEVAMRLVLELHEAFNRHDVAEMMRLMSEDCLFETTEPAPDGAVYSGKEAAARYWRNFFLESPQAHIEIEEIIGFGFRCVLRWRYEWIDAAGTKGHVRGVDIYKVKDGLISEKRSYVKG
jgi:predicted SnoaL-like aldol condensation-catalyzing enzyme